MSEPIGSEAWTTSELEKALARVAELEEKAAYDKKVWDEYVVVVREIQAHCREVEKERDDLQMRIRVTTTLWPS